MEMADLGGSKTMKCWLEVIRDCFQMDKDPLEVGAKKCPSPMQELLNNL